MRLVRIYKKPVVVLGLALALNVAIASSAMANLPGGSGSRETSSCELAPRIIHNEPGICSHNGYQPVGDGSSHELTKSVEMSGGFEIHWGLLAGLATIAVAAAGLSFVIRRPKPAL